MEALKAQGKTGLAQLVEERFKEAWERADITLSASLFARADRSSSQSLEKAATEESDGGRRRRS
jgi:hypothetical protein